MSLIGTKNDSETCKVMDGVAQYMTVILGNVTHSATDRVNCQAVRASLCNTVLCTLPGRAGALYSTAFLPCTDPIGYYTQYVDHSIADNVTLYESNSVTSAALQLGLDVTLDQLGSNVIGYSVSTL